jgi:hypothetical protein
MMGAQEEKRYREAQALEQARVDALDKQAAAAGLQAQAQMRSARAEHERLEIEQDRFDRETGEHERLLGVRTDTAKFARGYLSGKRVGGSVYSPERLMDMSDTGVLELYRLAQEEDSLTSKIRAESAARSRSDLTNYLRIAEGRLTQATKSQQDFESEHQQNWRQDAVANSPETLFMDENGEVQLRIQNPSADMLQMHGALMKQAEDQYWENNPNALALKDQRQRDYEQARSDYEVYRGLMFNMHGVASQEYPTERVNDGRATQNGLYPNESRGFGYTAEGLMAVGHETRSRILLDEFDSIRKQDGGDMIIKEVVDFLETTGPEGAALTRQLYTEQNLTKKDIDERAFAQDEAVRAILEAGGPAMELPDGLVPIEPGAPAPPIVTPSGDVLGRPGPSPIERTMSELDRLTQTKSARDVQNLDATAILTKVRELMGLGLSTRAIVSRLNQIVESKLVLEYVFERLPGANPERDIRR